jgi:hypothetical protein
MSFNRFIYYCALCGGWAAFVAWGIVFAAGIHSIDSLVWRATLIGGILGMLVAGVVGWLDALLNSVGAQRFVRVLLCLGLGFLGGMLGGCVGQLLNSGMSVPIFVGWILAGVLIGASIGVFDLLRATSSRGGTSTSLRKIVNGLLGGFVGGFLGGLPFTFLIEKETMRDLLPRSGLTICLVLLGICIGLFIGLAQVILKEAWLKVEAGFRPGRELMLSKDETTIGRAEGCDLGLFGDMNVEKVHARIVKKNNRYLLADEDTPGGTFLNDDPDPVDRLTPLRDGDIIRLGKSVLRFGERQKRRR